MIVFDKDPFGLYASWICHRLQYAPTTHFRTLSRVEGAQIRGVVGYDNWNQASCMMHVCGDGRWLTRELLFADFNYPFTICGLNCVFGLVPSGNEEALRFDRHLGFKDVVELKDAHPDGSMFLMRMDRDDCRWLRIYDEKQRSVRV